MTNTNKNNEAQNDSNYILPPIVDRGVEVAIYAAAYARTFAATRNPAVAAKAAQETVVSHYDAVVAAEKARVHRRPGRPRKVRQMIGTTAAPQPAPAPPAIDPVSAVDAEIAALQKKRADLLAQTQEPVAKAA